MCSYNLSLNRVAKRAFRSLTSRPMLAGIISACVCIPAALAQQSQPPQAEDPVALKNDIQQLKTQQQQILDSLAELKKLVNSRVSNAQPALKVPDTMSVDGELFRGEATAPVAIIEYADIECPFCRHFEHDIYPRVFDNYIKTGKVRLYYRDMPLPFHEHAMSAAMAAHCAGEQGKFWEMHDSLFIDKIPTPGPNGRSSGLTTGDIDERAANLGLDTTKLDDCMASTRFAENIDGTPTFVIGTIGPNSNIVTVKKTIVGAQPFGAFKAAIDPLLDPTTTAAR